MIECCVCGYEFEEDEARIDFCPKCDIEFEEKRCICPNCETLLDIEGNEFNCEDCGLYNMEDIEEEEEEEEIIEIDTWRCPSCEREIPLYKDVCPNCGWIRGVNINAF